MGARPASRAALLVASLIVMLALLISPAEAAFPGRNGWIVFSRTYPHSKHGDIWKMRRHGGSEDRLTTDSRHEGEPTWSPDGSRIVFQRDIFRVQDFQLVITDATGRTSHVVGGGAAGGHPTWSPNGTRIAYAAHIDVPSIAVLDLSNRESTPILSRTAPFNPAWSPNGSRIAFVASPSGRTDLFTMTPSGHDRVRLTKTRAWEFLPDWSPEGKQIVFIREHGDHPGDIFVIRAGGGGVTRLTDTPFDERSAAYSPNGKRIVFSRCCYGQHETSEIFVMHADGSRVHRLTHNEADDTAPDWQPIP